MDVFVALKAVTSTENAFSILRAWYVTKHPYFQRFVEEQYPDLYIACKTYARINGHQLR